ncbi:MAG: amidohydrolase family protein [Devosiaceae bacterium]|nr:amidohydrolase family protein [Devosiaceae bacterium MH13]
MRIDAHHHFWRISRGDYYWMPADPAHPLRRDFTPADLGPLLHACGIEKTVLVQAAETHAETEYLLGISEGVDHVAGVVGWVDFTAPDAPRTIERLADHPKLCGLRPMVQDYKDPQVILSDAFLRGLDALIETSLAFDALGYAHHLPLFQALLDRRPDLRCVIDHGMKPAIREDAFEPWAIQIRTLAENSSAVCKLSGLATEDGEGRDPNRIEPYIEHLYDCFGPDRLMWGSDWPPLVQRMSYADWFQQCLALVPDDAHQQVFSATAQAFYRLKV